MNTEYPARNAPKALGDGFGLFNGRRANDQKPTDQYLQEQEAIMAEYDNQEDGYSDK